MYDNIDEKIELASQRKQQYDSLTNQLPQIKEEWGKAGFLLQQLEAQIDRINEQIDELDSVSVSGLIAGITGNKQGKIDALNDQAMELEKQCDEVAQQVVDLDQQMQQMQSQIEELQDVDSEYQELMKQKRSEQIESGSEDAEVLQATSEGLEWFKDQQRELNKAIESGQRLTDRLFSMTKALGRAYNKKMMPRRIGAIAMSAFDVVHRKGTDPAIKRVSEGMKEFSQGINKLSLTDSEFDQELVRLGLVMDDYHNQLARGSIAINTGDMSVVDPMLEQVQMTVGQLETKLDQINEGIAAIENKEQSLMSEES